MLHSILKKLPGGNSIFCQIIVLLNSLEWKDLIKKLYYSRIKANKMCLDSQLLCLPVAISRVRWYWSHEASKHHNIFSEGFKKSQNCVETNGNFCMYHCTIAIDNFCIKRSWSLVLGRAQPIFSIQYQFFLHIQILTRLGCFYVTVILSQGYG